MGTLKINILHGDVINKQIPKAIKIDNKTVICIKANNEIIWEAQ